MPSVEIIKRWLGVPLNLVYPEICQLCETERATARDGFVCAQCWSHVRFIRPPFCGRCGLPFDGDITTPFECTNCREMELHFSSARSAVVAKTVVLEAIHRFKYQRALWFERFSRRPVVARGRAGVARTKLGFHRARPAASAETTRTGIQPGRTPRRASERRHRKFR